MPTEGIWDIPAVKLLVFTVLMFTVPLGAMFLSYHLIFIDWLHLSHQEAVLGAALVGVAAVWVVIVLCIIVAWREPTPWTPVDPPLPPADSEEPTAPTEDGPRSRVEAKKAFSWSGPPKKRKEAKKAQ